MYKRTLLIGGLAGLLSIAPTITSPAYGQDFILPSSLPPSGLDRLSERQPGEAFHIFPVRQYFTEPELLGIIKSYSPGITPPPLANAKEYLRLCGHYILLGDQKNFYRLTAEQKEAEGQPAPRERRLSRESGQAADLLLKYLESFKDKDPLKPNPTKRTGTKPSK